MASQITSENGYYHVWFPSIVWTCESVLYQHGGSHVRNQIEQIRSLELSGLESALDIGLLMSQVFWYTFIRCLDFDRPYRSDLIILSHGEIYAFQVRGDYYYVILYTSIHGKVEYFTNFKENSLFFSWFDDDTFTLYNRALGSIIFQQHYFSPDEIIIDTRESISDSYSIWVSKDWILWDLEWIKTWDFLDFIQSKNIQLIYTKNSSLIEVSSIYRDELLKLAGILWTHQAILWDSSLWKFLSRDNIIQYKIDNIKEIHYSHSISIFDEWWYIIRKNILSLNHLLDTLHNQRASLDWAIDAMDSLQSAHLELQKKRSAMTLEDITDSITIVENQLNLLIQLSKNRIS
jgi:hypothetical protein